MLFLIGSLSEENKLAWQTVWVAVVWSLWILRTSFLFHEEEANVEKVVDLIIFRSWCWLIAKLREFSFSLFEWSMEPMMFLSAF